MPRAFSSGALSIWSYAVNVAPPVSASTLVIAAVSDVLPWSTWPIVPMLQCGFVRSNFAFAIVLLLNSYLGVFGFDFVRDRQRHHRGDHLGVTAAVGALHLATPAVEVADHAAEEILRRHDFHFHHRLKQL